MNLMMKLAVGGVAAVVFGVAGGDAAVAPEPGAWALMIVGFGAAGSALRRRRDNRIYRLVEICDGGETTEELFPAPDDCTAIARARQVAQRFELWREDQRLAG